MAGGKEVYQKGLLQKVRGKAESNQMARKTTKCTTLMRKECFECSVGQL